MKIPVHTRCVRVPHVSLVTSPLSTAHRGEHAVECEMMRHLPPAISFTHIAPDGRPGPLCRHGSGSTKAGAEGRPRRAEISALSLCRALVCTLRTKSISRGSSNQTWQHPRHTRALRTLQKSVSQSAPFLFYFRVEEKTKICLSRARKTGVKSTWFKSYAESFEAYH